jgi:hypothetical protein
VGQVPDDIGNRLRMLHDEYAGAVNRAVAEGRDELVGQLVADYPDEALRIMSEAVAA